MAYVVFLVKDLVVDSVNGYLYWATLYSAESTRLNGEECLILQEQLQFAGKQVSEFFILFYFIFVCLFAGSCILVVRSRVHGCQN